MKKSLVVLFVVVFACSTPKEKEQEKLDTNQILSLLGEPLPAKTLSDSIRTVLDNNLIEAKTRYNQDADSVELAIWVGRRIAYIGDYLEAIEYYSEAIAKFPNDHRLYRHRGHRYISTRQLDKAIVDFAKATELAEGVPNQIEPDGIPNKLNQPLGNDRFNIYYHHALAYYLKGEYDKALPIYAKCLSVSDNPDLFVATTYWMYMTYHKLSRSDEAKTIVGSVSDEMEIIENDAYLNLILLFKGELSEEDRENLPLHPTYRYGVERGVQC